MKLRTPMFRQVEALGVLGVALPEVSYRSVVSVLALGLENSAEVIDRFPTRRTDTHFLRNAIFVARERRLAQLVATKHGQFLVGQMHLDLLWREDFEFFWRQRNHGLSP